jgi:2-keto-3-deoxy-L-fuconate dehydrogenase
MSRRLEGKTALITAAGQGIGRATALAFAAEGASVWATDVSLDKVADLAATRGITVRKLDVLDETDIAKVADEIAALDVLFNCAGFVHNGSILECTPKDWDFSFDLNVRAMYMVIRALLPKMLQRGSGSIINVASVASSVKGVPNRFAYTASKAAVIGLSKAIAADFVAKGVRCNAICPGTIDTPSLTERINAYPDPVKARQDFIARQPMGRLGRAEEIACAALYLAADESQFVTGQTLIVDGGMTV